MSLTALVLYAEFPLAFELLLIFTAAIAALVFLGVLIGVKRERHQENTPRPPLWLRNVMSWFLALALLAVLLIMVILIIWSIAIEIENTRQIASNTQNTGYSTRQVTYRQQASLALLEEHVAILDGSFR